jgi:hypothetical protein
MLSQNVGKELPHDILHNIPEERNLSLIMLCVMHSVIMF